MAGFYVKFDLYPETINFTYTPEDGTSYDPAVLQRHKNQTILGTAFQVELNPSMTLDSLSNDPQTGFEEASWSSSNPGIVISSETEVGGINPYILDSGRNSPTRDDYSALLLAAVVSDAFREGDPNRDPSMATNDDVPLEATSFNKYNASATYNFPDYWWVEYQITAPALFTPSEDVVDFNNLSDAQREAIAANPSAIYDALGANDTVVLPRNASITISPLVSWNASETFLGGQGNDNITGGEENDRIDGGPENDIIVGGEGSINIPDRDVALLAGSPTDYAFNEGDPSRLSAYNTLTRERDLIDSDVEFIKFEAFGDNAVSVNNVYHELAKLANRSYDDISPAQDGASGWRPVLAQELGLSPRATDTREYGIKYEMRDGIYRSLGATSIDPFGVVAHVSYAKVNGTPTLAVAFRGTTDFEDGLEYPGFSKYYDRYKPLVDTIKHYVQETDIPRVYVTGHSLGGAMAQMFMQETGVLGDDRYFGVTFGSPGAPRHAPDPRMFHFEHTDDRVVGLGKLAQSDDLPWQLKGLLSIFTEVRDYDTSGQAIRKVIPGLGLPNTEHAMDLYEKTALLSRSGISGKDMGTSTYVDGELVQDAHHYASEIYRLYQSALDRLPDMDGLVNWTGALKAGMTLEQAAGGFAASTEFRLHYGAPDNADFIKQLYLNVLDREADAGGLSNWTMAMSAGMTRAEALVGFSESVENIQRMAPVLEEGIWVRDNTAATVARLYDSVLDRLPDAGGLGAWTDGIKAGMGLDQAADGFTGSAEFQQRYGALDNTNFVKTLYRNVLDREAEPAGLANWKGALDAGVDRSDIVLSFSESAEHVMKLAHRIDDGIWLL